MKTVGIIVLVIILGGAWYLFSGKNTNDAMMQDTTMQVPAGDGMMQDEMIVKDGTDEMMATSDTMMAQGTYEAYAPEKVSTAGTDKVLLFFHAEWCPLCRPLDADILAHLSSIPAGYRILKVDYDTETALKQKYGVTYQHTIVEVDAKGTLIKKWAATTPTLAALLAEVK